jgi:hypothetical protein
MPAVLEFHSDVCVVRMEDLSLLTLLSDTFLDEWGVFILL